MRESNDVRLKALQMQLGSTMAARHISVLVAIIVSMNTVLARPPTIGAAYHHGGLMAVTAPLPESGSVRIQSTSTVSQTLPCSSDASCQALCPTEDITAQQPALSTVTVHHQVDHILHYTAGEAVERILCVWSC